MRTKLFALSAAVALTGAVGSIAACVGDEPGASPGTTTPEAGGPTDAPVNVTPDADAPDAADTGADADAATCPTSCTSDAGVTFACVQGKCGNEVIRVVGGYNHDCVVLLDGSAWCWGTRDKGELGTIDATPEPKPTKIALTDVAEVRLGNHFMCARTSGGDVYCWGDNTHGVLARQPGSDPGCSGTCSATPVKIAFPNNAKMAGITTGEFGVCARTQGATGGDVYCWGDKFGGITGDTSAAVGAIETTPTKIGTFSGDVIDVVLSPHDDGGPGDRPMACALRQDKSVWCWGVNHSGGLGHAVGTNGDVTCTANAAMNCNATPVKVEGLANVKSISTGGTFACVTTQAGAVYCWGNNSNGYLGNGTLTASPTPGQVPNLNTTVAVNAGNINAFALDSTGNVKAWGANGHGQLAQGNYAGSVCPSWNCESSAKNVLALTDIAQLSLNQLTGIALKKDGNVLTWGNNDVAQLGHAPSTNGDTTCGAGSGSCNPTPAILTDQPWRP